MSRVSGEQSVRYVVVSGMNRNVAKDSINDDGRRQTNFGRSKSVEEVETGNHRRIGFSPLSKPLTPQHEHVFSAIKFATGNSITVARRIRNNNNI